MTPDFSLDAYLELLLTVVPNTREVWLFGSRANGRERPDSDWDLLLCAPRNQQIFDALVSHEELHVDGVELFAPDPESDGLYRVPWKPERGPVCPTKWNWRPVSASEARYKGFKIDPGAPMRSRAPIKGADWPEGWHERENEKATRVWPRCWAALPRDPRSDARTVQ